MAKQILLALGLVSFCMFRGHAALTTQPSVRIAAFSGDRAAAISYTFDDNLRDQYTLAVPMLNEVGFKATFFVIAGRTVETPEQGAQMREDGNPRNLWGGISWPELKKMADEGHEIASHTWSHPSLTKLTPAELDAQFSMAHDAIRSHVGKPPLTVAFPGNGSNAAVQAAARKYHLAYRAYQQSTSGKTTVASLNAWADKLVQEGKWGILMTHGVAQGYAALRGPEILREHLKYVKSRGSDVWVDTFLNITRYTQERENTKLDARRGESSAEITLTCSLDPKLFDLALTIVLQAPSAREVSAKRNGAALPATVRGDSILIEAVPGDGVILVSWSARSPQGT